MSLAAIRTALRTTVDGMTGVDACYPRIPETKPNVDLFAIIETPSGQVQPHGTDLERREYLTNVYFATQRNGDLWTEQTTLEPYVDSFPTAMQTTFTLGGTTYGTRYADPAWEMVTFEIDDQAYIAIKFGLLHKQKLTVTYSG